MHIGFMMRPPAINADLRALVSSGALTLEQALRITEESASAARATRQAARRVAGDGRAAATHDEIRDFLRGRNATLRDFTSFKKIGGKEVGAAGAAYSHHGVNLWVYLAEVRGWPHGPSPKLALKVVC